MPNPNPSAVQSLFFTFSPYISHSKLGLCLFFARTAASSYPCCASGLNSIEEKILCASRIYLAANIARDEALAAGRGRKLGGRNRKEHALESAIGGGFAKLG